jgi:hypothetical protein
MEKMTYGAVVAEVEKALESAGYMVYNLKACGDGDFLAELFPLIPKDALTYGNIAVEIEKALEPTDCRLERLERSGGDFITVYLFNQAIKDGFKSFFIANKAKNPVS